VRVGLIGVANERHSDDNAEDVGDRPGDITLDELHRSPPPGNLCPWLCLNPIKSRSFTLNGNQAITTSQDVKGAARRAPSTVARHQECRTRHTSGGPARLANERQVVVRFYAARWGPYTCGNTIPCSSFPIDARPMNCQERSGCGVNTRRLSPSRLVTICRLMGVYRRSSARQSFSRACRSDAKKSR